MPAARCGPGIGIGALKPRKSAPCFTRNKAFERHADDGRPFFDAGILHRFREEIIVYGERGAHVYYLASNDAAGNAVCIPIV